MSEEPMPTESLDVAGNGACPAEPIHPGEHLAEIMRALDITQYRLAKTIGVPPIRIHDIVHRRRRLARIRRCESERPWG